MVQRKVSNYKLGIQGDISSNALKTQKKQQATNHTKPSYLQNHHHDVKSSKGADFHKAIKMKKSRSIKRSDVEVSLGTPLKINGSPRHPGKPPPPLFKSSTKKPSSCVPNYMKSTSSFEARKEVTTKVISSISSTSKLQKVLTKTPSLKKVRSLKKAHSLKLKQPARTAIKTCSSIQKDAKFPPQLVLNPGATEAKGKSVLRVCKYNHCSLNDHHPKSTPPLKRFLSSRRKLLKTEKTRIPVLSPGKEKSSECKGGDVGNQDEDFLVEIYVPDRGVDQQVSESLSDGPRSEIELQNDEDQTEDAKLSALNFTPEIEVSPPTPVKSDMLCVSLDESIYGKSELEWEEGNILTTSEIRDSEGIDIQNSSSNDHRKPGFDTENGISEYLGKCHEYPPYFYDEIVEYLCFSEAGSSPNSSESTQTGEEEDYCTLEEEATVLAAKLEEESIDKQRGIWSSLIKEITAAPYDDLVSYQDPIETDSNESDEDTCVIEETREEDSADIPQITDYVEGSNCIANNNDQGSTDHNEEENHSSEDKLESNENNVVRVNTSSRVGKSNNGESDSNQELLDSYNKLRKGVRCKKEHDDAEKEREFNPRGPNFLELEPEPDAEKVDLRHQEMDDRRNAEEWMLDHALQKTVNQLTPARKKKVALLVEAYETVLPVPKYELDTRRDSSVL